MEVVKKEDVKTKLKYTEINYITNKAIKTRVKNGNA